MTSNRPFSQSLRDALRGIKIAVGEGRNLRIHLVAGSLAVALGFAVELSRGEWILLTLTIALVLAAETFNSALEAAVDLSCPQRHPLAGKAKDLSAGAVLLTAVGALVVGILLFWRPALYIQWLQWALENPWCFLPVALGAAAAIWFIRGSFFHKNS